MKRRSFLRPGSRNRDLAVLELPSRDPLPDLSLNPRTGPLTDAELRHLLRRTGFGIRRSDFEAARGQAAGPVVEGILNSVATAGQPTKPPWVDVYDDQLDFERLRYFQFQWVERMHDHPFTEKMTLCWSNHLVANRLNEPSHQWHYIRKLRKHCIGNFKSMVLEIGVANTMLSYLNGNENQVGGSNENYARELVELFTTGRVDLDGNANYTEQDIIEMARALTGWRLNQKDPESRGKFYPVRFDNQPKTFFGRTGNFDHDDTVDIIFAERGEKVAENICRMLYEFFVYEIPNPTIIRELAATFMTNNWSIRAVLARLLKSEHFFQNTAIGARIKSPLEVFVGNVRECEIQLNRNKDFEDRVYRGTWPLLHLAARLTGQDAAITPNVAGWPEGRFWISTDTLARRGDLTRRFVYGSSTVELPVPDMRAWAISLVNDQHDPDEITRKIVEHVLAIQPNETVMAGLITLFKGDVSDNEYENRTWSLSDHPSAPQQLRQLVYELTRMPEYQLV